MQVTGEQFVNLPPQTVFGLFSRLELSGEYSRPVIERTRITEGPIGVGTQFHAVDQWPGRRVHFTVDITSFVEPELIEARWSKPMEGGWRAAFRPVDKGTQLSFEASMQPGGALRLLEPVLRPWAQRQTRAFLRDFTTWAEARAVADE